ncbi:MAG: hypothetical protein LDL24_11820, partial [Treponema sp.]|nr:hypothetical protein [Treponema sp.]
MILVDTSVLIDYFKGIESGPAKLFDELVEHGIPYGINTFVYQELLQGSKTIHEFNTLKEYLETMDFTRKSGQHIKRLCYLPPSGEHTPDESVA